MTGLTRGALGLQVKPLFDTPWATPYFYVIFTICVITYIVLRVIVKSNLGLAFTALGQDMRAARTTGVSPGKYRLINFCIFLLHRRYCRRILRSLYRILTPTHDGQRGPFRSWYRILWRSGKHLGTIACSTFITMPIFESMNSLVELKYIIYGLC